MEALLEPQTIRELLSVLVPLVAEGCAYDALAPDGTRRRLVAVHQSRTEEERLASNSARSVRARSFSVEVDDAVVGEVLVWTTGRMGAVEEALVVSTAERIAAEVERSTFVPPVAASVIADMVGHELRGPLQAMGFGIELLKTRVRDSADEIARDWVLDRLAGIERAAKRLQDVADRVAEMSRPVPVAAPTRQPVSLVDIVNGVVARMHDEIAWADCAVSVVRDASASFEGSWDRAHLETVVGNLVSNALKYGAKRPVELRIEATGDDVTLRVRDHGCGIAEAELPRVFERFYRGTTPSKLPGLGLGLALVAQLVHANGGEVMAESVVGDGATFTVRLPRGVSPEPARRLEPSRPGASSP